MEGNRMKKGFSNKMLKKIGGTYNNKRIMEEMFGLLDLSNTIALCEARVAFHFF